MRIMNDGSKWIGPWCPSMTDEDHNFHDIFEGEVEYQHTWLEGRRKTRRLIMYSNEQRENLATCGKIRSIGLPP